MGIPMDTERAYGAWSLVGVHGVYGMVKKQILLIWRTQYDVLPIISLKGYRNIGSALIKILLTAPSSSLDTNLSS
jgi:hypothetical protein